jgi:DNA-binding NarL/FixJ family response regulator
VDESKPTTKPPTTFEKITNEKLNLIKKTDNTTSLPSNNYILLISDNQADNIITEHYLIDFCRLDIATNANLGYKYARQNYYDIIMIDAALKEDHLAAQTINLLRTIKEYENTPIIVISNFLTPEERQTLITLKVAIVISKPFTKQDLIDYIKRLSAQ